MIKERPIAKSWWNAYVTLDDLLSSNYLNPVYGIAIIPVT